MKSVSWVTKVGRESNLSSFTAIFNDGVERNVVSDFETPVRVGVSIYAEYLEDGNVLRIKSFPYMTIPSNRVMVERYILQKNRKLGELKAKAFYDMLMELNEEGKGNGDPVANFLNECSVSFRKGYPQPVEIISAKTDMDKDDVIYFLRFWYREWNMMRFRLLGLTYQEVEESNMEPNELYEKIIKNPFSIDSYPIEKAVLISRSIDKEPNSVELICGKIIRKMKDCMDRNAWASVPFWLLCKEFPNFHSHRDMLESNYNVVFNEIYAYSNYAYEVESEVCKFFSDKIKWEMEQPEKPPNVNQDFVGVYSRDDLSEEQMDAIEGALNNEVTIITGGAGTGKTSIIKEIYENIKTRFGENKIAIASFTGKAVARIDEVLGKRKARTLDMMIRTPMDCSFEYLIIDESSMVSTELFYRFIKTFRGEYKVILVGDVNQLPPIGWGQLMSELIMSRCVKTYQLVQNYRVQNGSIILENAMGLINPMRDMEKPYVFREGNGFIEFDGDLDHVTKILTFLKIKKGKTVNDIKIICPYNKPIPTLNYLVQDVFLKESKRTVGPNGIQWCVGDRVMITKNNYRINVMNGEEGMLIDVQNKGIIIRFEDGEDRLFYYQGLDKELGFAEKQQNGEVKVLFKDGKTLIFSKKWKKHANSSGHITGEEKDGVSVQYNDGKECFYRFENSKETDLDISMLKHSFAITVHKSQGSEYKDVIIYMPHGYRLSKFLNINLFYTAFTRARESVFLVGSKQAIEHSTKNVKSKRYDLLSTRLKKLIGKEDIIPEQYPDYDDYPYCDDDDFDYDQYD